MSENKVAIKGVFVNPAAVVKARAPPTMTIETAVGKLLKDTTNKAQAAYRLESLSVNDMDTQYCPGKYAAPELRCY
jgi:hypothetical protein